MSASFLKIGGELVKDAILERVEITQELNQHSWCEVECRQTEDQRLQAEKCLGQLLQILIYDEAGTEHEVFAGFVLEAELTYEIYGSYTGRLRGVSYSYLMSLTPRTSYYAKSKLADIADNLAGKVGLVASVPTEANQSRDYVQWGESDFDFINRLADDNNCWVRPTASGLDMHNNFQPGTKLQWRGEDGLLTFKTKGVLGQPSFNGAHYDAKVMESKTYEKVQKDGEFYGSIGPLVDAVKKESKDKLAPGYVEDRSRAVTLDDYETLLKKESVRSIAGNIAASGESRNPALLPGNEVTIDGVLDANGTYGVTKVIHHWTPTGYHNEFWCTPWKQYTNPEPPSVRRRTGIVPARVVDNNDPGAMGRIKIQYFWQEDGPTHWARMLTPHAGADRGFMFMPEVGDEVIVAFEDGDPERPVVLGSVWNGVDKAPRQDFWGGDIANNDVKRIVTKSGHRMQFVDKKGKESIVVATPKELKVSLIESTDETGRSMLTLHSENGDIFLSAPNGRIHFLSKFFSREVG